MIRPYSRTTALNNPFTPLLNPQPSTLNPQPSPLNSPPSTLNPQPSTRFKEPPTDAPRSRSWRSRRGKPRKVIASHLHPPAVTSSHPQQQQQQQQQLQQQRLKINGCPGTSRSACRDLEKWKTRKFSAKQENWKQEKPNSSAIVAVSTNYPVFRCDSF